MHKGKELISLEVFFLNCRFGVYYYTWWPRGIMLFLTSDFLQETPVPSAANTTFNVSSGAPKRHSVVHAVLKQAILRGFILL